MTLGGPGAIDGGPPGSGIGVIEFRHSGLQLSGRVLILHLLRQTAEFPIPGSPPDQLPEHPLAVAPALRCSLSGLSLHAR